MMSLPFPAQRSPFRFAAGVIRRVTNRPLPLDMIVFPL
jgi:hypothetical protein